MDFIMTPEAALYSFMASFDIPAYASTAVPDDAVMPYITYDLVIGDWMQGGVTVPTNVWYKTDSEAAPNAKVRQISDALKYGGVSIHCDGGFIWIKKGSPWAQAMTADADDDSIKRRYLNVTVEYLTH